MQRGNKQNVLIAKKMKKKKTEERENSAEKSGYLC